MNSTTKKQALYEANIDSFNISHPDLLALFKHKDEYNVIQVHPSAKEDKGEHHYRTNFGKSFYNKTKDGNRVCPYSEVYVVHSQCGATFPITLHNKSKNFSYTADFAGLTGYHEKSEQLRSVLADIWEDIQEYRIKRLDTAIDFNGAIRKKTVTALLSSGRVAKTFENTTYYKKANQTGKSSGYVDILSYDKKKKNNEKELSGYDEVQRLEFRFFSNYFRYKEVKVKDLDIALKKIENFILKNADIHIKTSKLNVKKEKAVNNDCTQSSALYQEIYLQLIELKMMIQTYQLKEEISKLLTDTIKETIRSEVSVIVRKILVELFRSQKNYSSTNDKVQDSSKGGSNE